MAATFFGEVVWSRCRAGTEDDDDDDDDEGERDSPEDREVRRQLARRRLCVVLRHELGRLGGSRPRGTVERVVRSQGRCRPGPRRGVLHLLPAEVGPLGPAVPVQLLCRRGPAVPVAGEGLRLSSEEGRAGDGAHVPTRHRLQVPRVPGQPADPFPESPEDPRRDRASRLPAAGAAQHRTRPPGRSPELLPGVEGPRRAVLVLHRRHEARPAHGGSFPARAVFPEPPRPGSGRPAEQRVSEETRSHGRGPEQHLHVTPRVCLRAARAPGFPVWRLCRFPTLPRCCCCFFFFFLLPGLSLGFGACTESSTPRDRFPILL